jgi:glycosyltransferase involved in cell wall biosynthesis
MSTIKPKVLAICDHVGIPSGVGHMANLILTHLVKSGLQVVQMGGAVKHQEYKIQNVNGIKIYPVNVYGTPDDLRNIIGMEKPDMIFLFTDPRYFEWVWKMEDELRDKMPIYYYHVWDSDPIPQYNEKWYTSCDFISCISKLTHDIVKSFDVHCSYVPHGVNENVFKPLEDKTRIDQHRSATIQDSYDYDDDTFFVFWNNRNIRRKTPSHVIEIFSEFNKQVENSILTMHTNVVDGEGTDLYAVKEDLFPDTKVLFTDFKVDQPQLNVMYNASDVTVNFAYNEGFGLSTLESMAAGVPIVVSMTGGLQDQPYFKKDGKKLECGIGIKPETRTIVGSVPTPYIYDDRISVKEGVKALMKMYEMGKEGRAELGKNARQNVLDNFTADKMVKSVERDVKICLNDFEPRDPWTLQEYKK